MEKIGTVSENSLIGGRVIGINGVCFTLLAGTHGYGMGNFYDDRFVIVKPKLPIRKMLRTVIKGKERLPSSFRMT